MIYDKKTGKESEPCKRCPETDNCAKCKLVSKTCETTTTGDRIFRSSNISG